VMHTPTSPGFYEKFDSQRYLGSSMNTSTKNQTYGIVVVLQEGSELNSGGSM
jgi:hypothetical protein